jgi:hypothetical protein
MAHCSAITWQQVTLLGDAEWPKVADAVIEADIRISYNILPRVVLKGGKGMDYQEGGAMLTCADVARYFLAKTDIDSGDFLSNLKLQKLVYYAQGFSLVAPQLTVVPAPSCNQALERMRGTPSLWGWRPMRRWHMKRQ